MKSQTTPRLPPSLRPRPKVEISDGFAPIVPAVKPAPAAPAVVVAPPAPAPSKPKPVNPLVPRLEGRDTLFEGTFKPENGEPFTVQTPLTGNGARDRQSLVNLARKKHPTGGLRLASTRILTKETGAPEVFPSGTTLAGLFGPAGSLTENAVEAGEVFFQGERCSVILRNLRARSAVTVALRPPGGNAIVFSNQVTSNILAKTLHAVVKEIIGDGARELKISLKIEA